MNHCCSPGDSKKIYVVAHAEEHVAVDETSEMAEKSNISKNNSLRKAFIDRHKTTQKEKERIKSEISKSKTYIVVSMIVAIAFGAFASLFIKDRFPKIQFVITLIISIVVPLLAILTVCLWLEILTYAAGAALIVESILLFYAGFHVFGESNYILGKEKYHENATLFMATHKCECWDKAAPDIFCNASSNIDSCKYVTIFEGVVSFFIMSAGCIVFMGGCFVMISSSHYIRKLREDVPDNIDEEPAAEFSEIL
jgi:hypothetical protein